MKEYTIRYRHWSGFRLKKHVKFPDNFRELSRKQIVYYFKLLLRGCNKEELVHRFIKKFFARLPVVRILLQRDKAATTKSLYKYRHFQEAYENNASELDKLTALFRFFDGIRYFTIAPVRRLHWFFGPKDDMKNISIAEFAFAEKELISYLNKDTKAMNRLVAIFYRPLSLQRIFSKYDKRQALDSETIEKRARRLSRVSDAKKVAVLTWFQMIRRDLPEKFPNLFNQAKKSDDGEKYSWGDVIIQMSGEIPGKEDDVSRVSAWNFMYRLDLLIREQNEQKRKMKEKK